MTSNHRYWNKTSACKKCIASAKHLPLTFPLNTCHLLKHTNKTVWGKDWHWHKSDIYESACFCSSAKKSNKILQYLGKLNKEFSWIHSSLSQSSVLDTLNMWFRLNSNGQTMKHAISCLHSRRTMFYRLLILQQIWTTFFWHVLC